jgi:diaminohydroxyphosphoribosylaminopyrimidine deaminase/5-amino-6-(5-phosphoribosylamino)uracil reductase
VLVASPLSPKGKISLPFVLGDLAESGVTRLLVEAGQGVFTSFLTAGLWDHLYIMRAPVLIGADGRDAFGKLGVKNLDAAFRPVLVSREALGDDLLEIYTPPKSADGS